MSEWPFIVAGLFGIPLGVLAVGVLLWKLGKRGSGEGRPLKVRVTGVITAIIGALLIFGGAGALWIMLVGFVITYF